MEYFVMFLYVFLQSKWVWIKKKSSSTLDLNIAYGSGELCVGALYC